MTPAQELDRLRCRCTVEGASMKQKLNKRSPWLAPEMRNYDNRTFRSLMTGTDERWIVAEPESNVVGSRVLDDDGKLLHKHMPIVDLDYPHEYRPSSSEGHGHLFLNKEIGHVRWVLLMLGLWAGGVISRNYMLWSFRRMGNFARQPWEKKQ